MSAEELREHFLNLMEEDQHDPDIQYEIGRCYLLGEGVEQNGSEAQRWLQLAAEQGSKEAAALLSSGGTGKPREEEICSDNLPDWCMRAEDGDVEAQYRVAEYFLQMDLPGTREDAERYLAAAVEQGLPEACLLLARRKLKDGAPTEAAALLRNAADCGFAEAMELLGECCVRGLGVEPDPAEAERWFAAAAERGGGEAMVRLAVRYQLGDGVMLSPGKAMNWIKKAQEAGVPDARERAEALAEERGEVLRQERLREQQLREKMAREEEQRLEQERRLAQEQLERDRQAAEAARQADRERQAQEEARRRAEQNKKRRQENWADMLGFCGPALLGFLYNVIRGQSLLGSLVIAFLQLAACFWGLAGKKPNGTNHPTYVVSALIYAYYVGMILNISYRAFEILIGVAGIGTFVVERRVFRKRGK